MIYINKNLIVILAMMMGRFAYAAYGMGGDPSMQMQGGGDGMQGGGMPGGDMSGGMPSGGGAVNYLDTPGNAAAQYNGGGGAGGY